MLPLPQVPPQPAPLSSPGVLILSITREPLYITPSAHKLLAELDGSTEGSWADTILPLAVQYVCNELQHDGKQDPGGTDWDKMHVRHLARTAYGTILVRGYGILDQRGAKTGRFLILLETVPTESYVHETHGETDCQFTVRQRGIVNGLVLGLTNKEIAETMMISVHTVKEYVRQLMMKLHTASRTGIVARVAGLTLPSPKASGHRRSPAAPAAAQVV
jgi:DNA-binding CsgD family transcriptional regulator